MSTITGNDVQAMVGHWLKTPVGGYLGSSYGSNAKEMLQAPQASGVADNFLRKLRADVPVLSALPGDAVNLYARATPPDRTDLFIDISGRAIQVGD
ncbi:hypothetical protein F6R98_10735 [Candidatus Methylospira mobilis]|uniref:Uncharacterized protein n=1 Tax=Candidatus Methylospira mobilis TaxID=1808979 RepID=A0A5Q0BGS9_9GAMM|nr:hypothetical protein [Candidatus Methylospira mobilis]QFY43033.1 hypothetical protein F6R98_10735 [Candidatus Methylospira mobilis]